MLRGFLSHSYSIVPSLFETNGQFEDMQKRLLRLLGYLTDFVNFIGDKIFWYYILLFEAQLLYEILKKIRKDNFYTELKRKWLHQARLLINLSSEVMAY